METITKIITERNNGVDLSFENLSYYVKSKNGPKKILDQISGKFESGKLIGILGPSGAGKTTLLNILSGFVQDKDSMSGRILVNDVPRNMTDFKKLSSYITQENDLNTLLTVEENMKFAAEFKLGTTVYKKRRAAIIEDILNIFGLTEVRHVRTKNLSGGQQKRLSVAQELVANPSIVFLDEPTTGLDSYTAQRCMEYFKTLAGFGKTIICTIHQPPASMFLLFDSVYVMSAGKCVYNGGSNALVHHLEHVHLPCSVFHNPADYIIELANGDYGDAPIESLINAINNGKKYAKTDKDDMLLQRKSICNDEENIFNGITRADKRNLRHEISVMFRREYLKMKRNFIFTYGRILVVFINSCFITSLFYNIGNNSEHVWHNFNSAIALIANLVFAGAMMTAIVFPFEFNIVKREHFNGYYTLKTYLITITLFELPISLIQIFVSTFQYYYFTGQEMELFRLGMVLALCFAVSICSQTVGLMFGAMMNLQNASFFAANVHIPLILFSGAAMRFVDYPQFLKFMPNLTYLKYAVTGVAAALIGYNKEHVCPEEALFCYFKNGDTFLKYMGIQENFWSDLFVLVALYFVLRVVIYYLMRRKLKG